MYYAFIYTKVPIIHFHKNFKKCTLMITIRTYVRHFDVRNIFSLKILTKVVLIEVLYIYRYDRSTKLEGMARLVTQKTIELY